MQVIVEQMLSGNLTVPGSVFKMMASPGDPKQPAPFLGQHNTEVYADVLGYDTADVRDYQKQGII